MPAVLTYPHIEKLETQPARLTRIPRVRVAQIVMDQMANQWSVEEICESHPYLKPAEAHAALAYYYDHKEEIDAEIEADQIAANKLYEQDGKTPIRERLGYSGRY